MAKIRDFTGREVVYTYDDNGDLAAVRAPMVSETSSDKTEAYTCSSSFAESELNYNFLSITYTEEIANGGPPDIVWTYGEDPNDSTTFDRVLAESLGGGRINASEVTLSG